MEILGRGLLEMSNCENDPGSSMKFTFKDLIDLIKQHPCLYNKNDANYKNNYIKDLCWQIISGKLNQPQQVCISEWEKIRRKYMKERRNENSRWFYLHQCAFLKDHVSTRRSSMTPRQSGETDSLRVRNIRNYLRRIKEELRELDGAVFKEMRFMIIKEMVNAHRKGSNSEPKKELCQLMF